MLPPLFRDFRFLCLTLAEEDSPIRMRGERSLVKLLRALRSDLTAFAARGQPPPLPEIRPAGTLAPAEPPSPREHDDL